MTSWVGTSMVIVRRLTRTIRSIGQNTQIRPGPFGSASNRPIRKITPRSYSRSTFSELKSQIKTIITAISTNGNWSMVVLWKRVPNAYAAILVIALNKANVLRMLGGHAMMVSFYIERIL